VLLQLYQLGIEAFGQSFFDELYFPFKLTDIVLGRYRLLQCST